MSQPVIRGTYKGLKHADPLHLVEPGEFILGYPTTAATGPQDRGSMRSEDPGRILPVLDDPSDFGRVSVDNQRDLGANGSFLVIRQSEQDRAAFDAYSSAEADRLRNRLGPPYRIDAELIAAKPMGRWRNGSPLCPRSLQRVGDPASVEDNGFPLGGRRTPKGCAARSAPTFAVPIRATASTRDRWRKSRSAAATG